MSISYHCEVVKLPSYQWGVDSAQNVTEDLFQCVLSNFGYPVFWGRYLVRVPNISEGLTEEEISFIHSKGVKLLPIYNAFQEARGYMQGQAAAATAAFYAHMLGIPEGTPLFADVESDFQVDKDWIQGWTEGMAVSGYKSGIYNDPSTGGFNRAFCNAVKENEEIKTLNILWSATPVLEPSGPGNPPFYRPHAPACGGNVCLWQYSRDTPACPIDTNLAPSSFVNMLW